VTDQSLPYSFDLWFDIKSREDLVRRYSELKQELTNIEEVMASHEIEFTPDELVIIMPDASLRDTGTPKP
jgi:hypothetical protein